MGVVAEKEKGFAGELPPNWNGVEASLLPDVLPQLFVEAPHAGVVAAGVPNTALASEVDSLLAGVAASALGSALAGVAGAGEAASSPLAPCALS